LSTTVVRFPPVHTAQAHAPHQTAHSVATHLEALLGEFQQHPALPARGVLQVQFVHEPHDLQVLFAGGPGLVVQRAAREAKRRALLGDRELRVRPVDQQALLRRAHRNTLF
jgi:hypothetical protein